MENANKNDNGITFQERFKELVGNSTQEEVAKKINTSRQNVGNWLNGKSRPDIYALTEISKGFNVSTDYLLGLTDIKSTDTTVQGVCEYTGLNENSVNVLLAYKKIQKYTRNIDVSCKYSLVDTLNCIIEELGEESNIIFSLNNALNYNNSDIEFEEKANNIRDEFYEKFPKANEWLEGKGVIYGRDENFYFLKNQVGNLFESFVINILRLYNPTDFQKEYGSKPFREYHSNIFELLKDEKEYWKQK